MHQRMVRLRRRPLRPPRQLGGIPQPDYEYQGPELLDPGGGVFSDYYNGDTTSIFPFIAGLASQLVIPLNPLRLYLLIQNNSAGASTGDIFINLGQSATATNSLVLPSGGVYEQTGVGGGRSLDPEKMQFSSGAFIGPDSVHVLGEFAGMACVIIEGLRPAIQVRG